MKIGAKTLLTAALSVLPLYAEAGAVDQLHQFLNGTRTLKAEFSQTVAGKSGTRDSFLRPAGSG